MCIVNAFTSINKKIRNIISIAEVTKSSVPFSKMHKFMNEHAWTICHILLAV